MKNMMSKLAKARDLLDAVLVAPHYSYRVSKRYPEFVRDDEGGMVRGMICLSSEPEVLLAHPNTWDALRGGEITSRPGGHHAQPLTCVQVVFEDEEGIDASIAPEDEGATCTGSLAILRQWTPQKQARWKELQQSFPMADADFKELSGMQSELLGLKE